MKSISLWEPWASLWVAQIDKLHETRSWPCWHKGPLAIHAAKVLTYDTAEMCLDPEQPFAAAIKRLGITRLADLPRGAVIGVCDAIISYKTEEAGVRKHNFNQGTPEVSARERQFGDFSAGRFFWKPINMRALPQPIPARGSQGIWNWEPPADVLAWLIEKGVQA